MSSVKQLTKNYDELIRQIKSSTPAEVGEDPIIKRARIDRLMGHWPSFMKYYFPKWAKSDFAPFHMRCGNAVMEWKEKKMIVAWAMARNLSKTTFWQMMAIYINCRYIMKLRKGFEAGLWMSQNKELAMRDMYPIMLQYEHNQRLINDFGEFKSLGQWEQGYFVTQQGISWLALGKEQSPRGTKNEDVRVNFHIWNDFDDDEECQNPNRLDKTWERLTKAYLGTLDVSGEGLIVGLNNIIHEKSLMKRLTEIADWTETVNLLDNKGRPTWNRFTLADCQYMIKKMGSLAAESEYFNNPIVEGKVFKKEWIQWKPMPLKGYVALLAYLDPSFSDKANSDHKSWLLLGLKNSEIHVIKAFCDRASVSQMIEWGYEIEKYVKERNEVHELWMEEVFLQSLLYKDFHAAGLIKGWQLPVQGDKREKPDKDRRIMACQGYFERGEVYFNIDEAKNHHMENLVFQFTSFEPGKTRIKKDGPDSFEGGKHILFDRVQMQGEPTVGKLEKSKNNY